MKWKPFASRSRSKVVARGGKGQGEGEGKGRSGANDILSKGGHQTGRTLRHINGLALAAPWGLGSRRVRGGCHLPHSLQQQRQLKFCLFSSAVWNAAATPPLPPATDTFS